MLQKLIYSSSFLSSCFSIFTFLFLKIFLDKPAMLLRYWNSSAHMVFGCVCVVLLLIHMGVVDIFLTSHHLLCV